MAITPLFLLGIISLTPQRQPDLPRNSSSNRQCNLFLLVFPIPSRCRTTNTTSTTDISPCATTLPLRRWFRGRVHTRMRTHICVDIKIRLVRHDHVPVRYWHLSTNTSSHSQGQTFGNRSRRPPSMRLQSGHNNLREDNRSRMGPRTKTD